MPKRHLRDPESEAAAALARPEMLSAERLVQLIHEVNPTSHAIGRRSPAERYRLKAALQSLLIERFSDELEVEPANLPGTVGLRHRFSGADACHAIIDDLGEHARAWVRRELDLRVAPGDAGAPSAAQTRPRREATDDPPSELVDRGRSALREYDYERARREFEAAFVEGGGASKAAVALLELFIDHLGLYREALELEPRLSDSARQNEEVRGLLALAAAQSGDRQTAQRWLRGTRGGRSTEALAQCVRIALAEGAVGEVWGLVARLRERAPGYPELGDWQRATDALQAARGAK